MFKFTLCFPKTMTFISRSRHCTVADHCFSAHKIILAGTIPYFEKMFTHDMKESTQDVIKMKDIDPEALELLIGFAYSGKVQICTLNVQSLLFGASYLQLTKVRDACCDFIKKRLHPNNVLAIKSVADALGCTTLVEAAKHCIQMQFTVTACNEEFNNLELADLKEIISQDKLCTREEQVFEAVISWVKSDASRQKYLPELLTQVRMPLLTLQYLSDHVATEELVRTSLQCRDLLDEAIFYHIMPEKRPLLRSFRTSQRCGNIGCIYVIGCPGKRGNSVSTVEMYDPKVAKWQMDGAINIAGTYVSVAVLHNKLYAIGGKTANEPLSKVLVFDPELHSWSTVASMNCKRSFAGAATLFNKLYVCGGHDGDRLLNTVESYEPEKNVWSMVTSMSADRKDLGVVAFEDHIYAIGGWNRSGPGGSIIILDSVERYNPLTGQWDSMPPMLTKRCRMAVTTLNGHIYVCGGEDATSHLSAEVYTPSTNQWSYIASMNVKRRGVALVANYGKLFAIGGFDGTTPLGSVEAYDPEFNRWDLVVSMCAHKGYSAAGVIPSYKTDLLNYSPL